VHPLNTRTHTHTQASDAKQAALDAKKQQRHKQLLDAQALVESMSHPIDASAVTKPPDATKSKDCDLAALDARGQWEGGAHSAPAAQPTPATSTTVSSAGMMPASTTLRRAPLPATTVEPASSHQPRLRPSAPTALLPGIPMTGSVHDVDELGDSLKLAFSLVPPPSAIVFEDCIPGPGPAGAQRDQAPASGVRRAGSGNFPSQMPSERSASDFHPPVVNHHASASPVRAQSPATHMSASSKVLDLTFELSPMPPIDFSLPFDSPEALTWGVERADATAPATDAPRVSAAIQAATDTAPERSHALPFEMPQLDMFPPLSVASPGPAEHGAAAGKHAKETQAQPFEVPVPFEVPLMDVSSPLSVATRDPTVHGSPPTHQYASSKAPELPFELSPMPPIDFSLPSDSPRLAAPTLGVEREDATKSVAEAPRVSTELQAAADPPPARSPALPFELPPLDTFPPLSVASPYPAEHGTRSKDAAVEHAEQTQALPKAGVIAELQPLLQARLCLAGLTSDEATPLLAKMDKDLLQRALTTGDVQPVMTKLKAAAYQRPEMNKLGASSRNMLQNLLLAPGNQMPPRPSAPRGGGEGLSP